ncbi:MAG: hypothetical protein WAM77_07945 [Xanthobacteraceae bacterium]
MKPRCRWAIVAPDGTQLHPYRLKLAIVENTRVGGKVKQRVVTTLGTFDATWLESFWAAAPDPAIRTKFWELRSLQERVEFWDAVRTRMGAIGDNRLSEEDRVALRRQIHKVVPWPMEADRKRLDVLKLGHAYWDVDFWRVANEECIVRNEEQIKRLTEENDRMRTKNAESVEQRVNQHVGPQPLRTA